MTITPRPTPRSSGNELAKALLIDTSSGVGHAVMYNPEELRLEQGNSFAEVAVPGLDSVPIQYVRGKSRTIAMDLFFDTNESGDDVRVRTGPIVRLLDTQPQTHAPPVLLFSLGQLQFTCVLVDATQRFTMFRRDGTPVRSTISVKLQEHVRVDVEVRQGLFFGSTTASAAANRVVRTAQRVAERSPSDSPLGLLAAAVPPPGGSVHVTRRGDTLSALASTYLGHPARWREIALANDVADPVRLPVGVRLQIPGVPTPSQGGLA